MKKFVSFALALMVALSVCATSLATTSCSKWMDTGAVTSRTCQHIGCGVASWMSVMKGYKEQSRVCQSNSSGSVISKTEYRTVDDYGDCC